MAEYVRTDPGAPYLVYEDRDVYRPVTTILETPDGPVSVLPGRSFTAGRRARHGPGHLSAVQRGQP